MKSIENTQQELLQKQLEFISATITKSFKVVAPFWPLKNLIAINPLQGFEDLPIEEALERAEIYFEQSDLPEPMREVNNQSIKWLKAYCDQGQATIQMPLKKKGLYAAWRRLALYDATIHTNDQNKQNFIKNLPETPEEAIAQCFSRLSITDDAYEEFLTLMITTLPGWASHIQYLAGWNSCEQANNCQSVQADYLAMRLVMTTLIWPQAVELLTWHKKAQVNSLKKVDKLKVMQGYEDAYRLPLLKKIAEQSVAPLSSVKAQFVFCIDVRSEPFRRSLESLGNYATLGFAGFFGVALKITNKITGVSYSSCPVLLSPAHTIEESPESLHEYDSDLKGYENIINIKKVYQSLKYTFATPFVLAEVLGAVSGFWMWMRCFMPAAAVAMKSKFVDTVRKPIDFTPSIDSISLADQCVYGEKALKMMGLVNNFAPIVVLCGHGSTTHNNAYATALDCGACAGRHGGINAQVLAAILNSEHVRIYLQEKTITIPSDTVFVAAQHNTTTDELVWYDDKNIPGIQDLKRDAEQARSVNSLARLKKIGETATLEQAHVKTKLRSQDWAQVRPEWGLSTNAAFIIAPRDVTYGVDLEGRSFLHSYDYRIDEDGSLLTTILTAPMIVTQWINAQYLFSTLDNVAYGAGSKVTQNITGKMGVMQGNASDLMTGLPLQSLFKSDTEEYHEPLRLMTVVYCPRQMVDKIITEQLILQKLFGNGWVQLVCIEPVSRENYMLQRDFSWKKVV